MWKRIAAIWLSLVILLGFIVIVIEFVPNVKGSTIIYVDDEIGSGPGNPPEDYTIIQEAIDAANDGDTVFVYNGIYYNNVSVDKTINLTGEDRDNTILDTGTGGDLVRITRNWVNVSGFTIRNSGNDGITLMNVQNCRVFNLRVLFNNNYGIWVRESNNITIKGNVVQKNGKGIYVSDSSRNNITGNELSVNDNGIQISNSFENIINLNIVDLNSGKGITLYESNNNRIVNNNLSFNDMIGINLVRSKENTLKDNTMKNNGIYIQGNQLELWHWNTHNIDTSNTVNGKPVQYWKNRTAGKIPAGAGQVILANCTNISVEEQELTYASVGISLGLSSKNSIIGNNVSSNSMTGIHLFFSNENHISGNNVSFTSWAIEVHHSILNNIIGNMVFSNEFLGIHLFSYSSENQIIDNTISSNGGIGIFIETTSSKNNTIYHNNVINNTVQAMDDTNNGNYWDNGYPDGGNFWSDFNELGEGAYDDYEGPNQDVPGSDDIVDNGTVGGGGRNPYIIDSDSQDNYPLIFLYDYMFLYEGWNLISVPLIQSDNNLDAVLAPIAGSYDAVQYYNVSDTSDQWKHNHIQKLSPLNDLTKINHTMGFWIHITEPGGVIFEYNGTKPTQNQSIPLHVGWNLVGYPSLTSYNRTDGLNSVLFGPDVDCIQWYEASSGAWHFMGPDDLFLPGRGYWVHSNVETVWDVPL